VVQDSGLRPSFGWAVLVFLPVFPPYSADVANYCWTRSPPRCASNSSCVDLCVPPPPKPTGNGISSHFRPPSPPPRLPALPERLSDTRSKLSVSFIFSTTPNIWRVSSCRRDEALDFLLTHPQLFFPLPPPRGDLGSRFLCLFLISVGTFKQL